MSNMYKQCKFKNGNTFQTAWVEDKPSLRVGNLIELKSDNKEKWEVVAIGEVKHVPQLIHTWQM